MDQTVTLQKSHFYIGEIRYVRHGFPEVMSNSQHLSILNQFAQSNVIPHETTIIRYAAKLTLAILHPFFPSAIRDKLRKQRRSLQETLGKLKREGDDEQVKLHEKKFSNMTCFVIRFLFFQVCVEVFSVQYHFFCPFFGQIFFDLHDVMCSVCRSFIYLYMSVFVRLYVCHVFAFFWSDFCPSFVIFNRFYVFDIFATFVLPYNCQIQ